jgi:MFS transporter, UMF1 family
LYDWGNGAFAVLIQTFVFAAYFTGSVALDKTTATTQWGNTIGFTGLAIAILGPVLGAIADQGGRRKPWMAGFALLTAVATGLMWFVMPEHSYVVLALVLVSAGTLGSEVAFIFYNAMLGGLVPAHRIGRWSGWGWACGYGGGLLCLVLALQGLVKDGAWLGVTHEHAAHVRWTFVLVAVWFVVFTTPLFLFTPDTKGTGKPLGRAVRDGLGQLGRSLGHLREMAHILRFLIARMIYIDGLATIFAFGGIFAKGTFDMTDSQIILFGILLNVTAGIGAFGFSWIDDWIGSKRTILFSLACVMVAATVVLTAPGVMWFTVSAAVLGIFVGPVQAASRSYYVKVVPPELSNEMFGLYAFSGKATAFAGPLLVAWVTSFASHTGWEAASQRIGMSVVLVMFVVGGLLMLTVPSAERIQKQRMRGENGS